MLTPGRSPQRGRHGETEAGFTLIELLVTASVLLIVGAIAGAGLISLSTAASRATGMVGSQEQVTAAATTLARDIRSTHALTAASASSLTAEVNQPAGGTQTVTWTASGTTLTRQVAGGTAQTILTGLASTSVFSYQAPDGTSLAGATGTTIDNCAGLVGIDLQQTAPSAVKPFEDQQSVAITDQVEALATQGGGGCP